jgi:hypothetical protein
MRRRRSIDRREQAERRFPWRVDVRVPELGLQERLPAMLDWCECRLGGIEGWDQHGVTLGRGPTGIPIDAARFYFASEADALAFRREWGGEAWNRDT